MADWIFTVSEVGDFIKRTIDSEMMLQNIGVRGEISDLRRSAAGHVYFTLKDERSLIKCVWFKQDQKALGSIAEGMRVVARGRLSYYTEQGQLNFYIRELKSDGVGSLFLLFEQRRERFRLKGWFDAERKKPLPPYPNAVGVVTSPTGAVIRDIIRIARRRNPGVKIVLYPVKVQGEGAAAEIAAGIRAFNRIGGVDALIVGRGGGSFEDLWEFNDEAVVSAIVESSIPVVTAIGHETDFSLADFAADVRAATPSEAAELLVPNVMALASGVDALAARMTRQMESVLGRREQEVAYLRQALELNGPRDLLIRYEMRLDNLGERMQTSVDGNFSRLENSVETLAGRLPGLNPAAVLERGYAAVFSFGRNAYVSRGIELSAGEEVSLRFADTERAAKITDGIGG
jgi:exodeoxyribonuclease VII large subunit